VEGAAKGAATAEGAAEGVAEGVAEVAAEGVAEESAEGAVIEQVKGESMDDREEVGVMYISEAKELTLVLGEEYRDGTGEYEKGEELAMGLSEFVEWKGLKLLGGVNSGLLSTSEGKGSMGAWSIGALAGFLKKETPLFLGEVGPVSCEVLTLRLAPSADLRRRTLVSFRWGRTRTPCNEGWGSDAVARSGPELPSGEAARIPSAVLWSFDP
jgi:hypothetical protein